MSKIGYIYPDLCRARMPKSLSIFALHITALLTGCTSFQELCTEEGYQPGTAAFATCISEKQKEAQTTALIFATGMHNTGTSWRQQAMQQQAMQQQAARHQQTITTR